MILPLRLSPVIASLTEARRFTRTNQPQALALLGQAVNALDGLVEIDLSDSGLFTDGDDPKYFALCGMFLRLSSNLHVARLNLATWPGTMEGYIDGARIELEQLASEIEKGATP